MSLVIGLATICSTLFGGLFAIKFKDKLHLILGFSAGAVIGVALFDLIPESISLVTQSYDIQVASLFMVIGFAFFLTLDRFFSLHLHGHDSCENPGHKGEITAAALAFHSFLDGLGIGLAFKVSSTIGWTVAVAVLAHDFSDGINTVNIILKNKGDKRKAIKWLAIDAVAPALGVLSTLFFSITEPTLGLVLATFTGFFLYIGASDLIPESHHNHPSFWTTATTILGIALLCFVINLAG